MEQNRRHSHNEAASEERRRIESVTAGFQSLMTLLPPQEGEKLRQVVIDPNAFDDFADPHLPREGDLAPPYNVYIPPRTHGGKRKKSKNRRRHSETIWTIVSELENQHPHFATTPKPSSSKQKSKAKGSSSKDKDKDVSADKSFLSSPSKLHKESEKKGKSKKKKSKDATASFLDNPIFESELKNWTLPRAELWCRDPQCQINVQLWNDYCQSHQSELTQLQVQELLHQQHQYAHQQQQLHQPHICQHPAPPPPPPAPPLPQQRQRQTRFLSDTALPPDLPSPAALSRRQRISTISHILDGSDGATTNNQTVNPYPGCTHSIHHQQPSEYLQQSEEDEPYYSHQYGNMPVNMSIGVSMNNLGGHPSKPHPQNQDSGVGTPSSSTSVSSQKNIVPTALLPQSSGGSGGSSAKTATTTVGSSSPSSVEGGRVQVKSSSRGEKVGATTGGGSKRDNFHSGSSSSSTSSSSSSSEDVSSGSTFVTGFESSDSRGSSVPSSLNKPPHPNLIEPSNNGNNKTNTNHHHHRNSKSYGDNNAQTTTVATTAASGYPSVPYLPAGYRKPGICPSCNGLVPTPSAAPNHHLIPVDPILSAAGLGGHTDATLGGLPHHHHHTTASHQYHHNITSANANKSDNAFWNFSKFQHPLQRDHSFHSVGGFTLNGQYNTQAKKRPIVKFCSSHKIALVVSTFSLMVTIGLIITLLLMKKRGMMDTMDMMPT